MAIGPIYGSMNMGTNTSPSGPAIPDIDPTEQHARNTRELMLRVKAHHMNQQRAIADAYRPFAEDPEDWHKLVGKKPQRGAPSVNTQGAQPSRAPAAAQVNGQISPAALAPVPQGAQQQAPDAYQDKLARLMRTAELANKVRELRSQTMTPEQRAQAASVQIPPDVFLNDLRTKIMQRDTNDMANRGNLPRYGASPVSPDTARLAAGVGPGPVQWGFTDRPPLEAALAAAAAKHAASEPGRRALAAMLQERQRNDPTAFRQPGLTPNLAAAQPSVPVTRNSGMPNLTPEQQADIAAWQNNPNRNTLTPAQFADQGGGTGNAAAGMRTYNERQLGFPQLMTKEDRDNAIRESLSNAAQKYKVDREAELARRRGLLEAKIAQRRGAVGPSGERPLPLIDPSTSWMFGIPPQAALEHNRQVYQSSADSKERGLDRDERARTQMAALAQAKLEHNERMGQQQAQLTGQMAHYKELERQGLITGQQRADAAEQAKREHEQSMAKMQQHHDEQMAALKAQQELDRAKIAGRPTLTPEQVGAMAPEALDWMQQNAPWMMPQAPGGGSTTTGSTVRPPTELTERKKGDIMTTAINQNLENPYAAYQEMLAGNIPHEEALAAVRSRHPLVSGNARFGFDPFAPKTPVSGAFGSHPWADWLETGWRDALVPDFEFWTPEEVRNRKKGLVPK